MAARGRRDRLPVRAAAPVPRVDREEFINVGVVLFAQGAGFLDAAGAGRRGPAAAPRRRARPRRGGSCSHRCGRSAAARRAAGCRPSTARPALRLDHRAPLDHRAAGPGPRRPLPRPGRRARTVARPAPPPLTCTRHAAGLDVAGSRGRRIAVGAGDGPRGRAGSGWGRSAHMATAEAAATLSESTPPAMGMRTVTSAAAIVRGPRPSPSAPSTSASRSGAAAARSSRRHGVIGEGQRRDGEPGRPQLVDAVGPGVDPGPRHLEDRAHRDPDRPPVERVGAPRRHQHRIDARAPRRCGRSHRRWCGRRRPR